MGGSVIRSLSHMRQNNTVATLNDHSTAIRHLDAMMDSQPAPCRRLNEITESLPALNCYIGHAHPSNLENHLPKSRVLDQIMQNWSSSALTGATRIGGTPLSPPESDPRPSTYLDGEYPPLGVELPKFENRSPFEDINSGDFLFPEGSSDDDSTVHSSGSPPTALPNTHRGDTSPYTEHSGEQLVGIKMDTVESSPSAEDFEKCPSTPVSISAETADMLIRAGLGNTVSRHLALFGLLYLLIHQPLFPVSSVGMWLTFNKWIKNWVDENTSSDD